MQSNFKCIYFCTIMFNYCIVRHTYESHGKYVLWCTHRTENVKVHLHTIFCHNGLVSEHKYFLINELD